MPEPPKRCLWFDNSRLLEERKKRKEPLNPKPTTSIRPPKVDQTQHAKRRRAQEAVASLTADEIQQFIAHSDSGSDGVVDDDLRSEDSSDWDDVQEEAEPTTIPPTCNNNNSCAHTSSQAVIRDVGVSELFEVNQPTSCSVLPDAECDILSYSAARRSELSEYGSQIKTSLSTTAAHRHDKRVERHVAKIIQAEEQLASTKLDQQNAITDPQKKALEMRMEKQTNAISSLASGSAAKTSSSSDYFIATPTTIRVLRPQISHELWTTRTASRRVFGLSQYLREATSSQQSASLQADSTVVVAVVGSRVPPRRSRNDKVYSIWRLTDLATVGVGAANGNGVSLFLFGAVHEKLWKEPEGTVVAILKPKQLPQTEHDSGNGNKEISITVDSAPFVMLLGTSPDYAVCAGITKAGRPCTRIVNKSVCRYCDFHVKSAYFSASSARAGFTTTSFPRTGHGIQKPAFCGSGGPLGSNSFSLQRPTDMPANRSQDSRLSHGHVIPSQRAALSMAKLTSAGYTIDPTSSSLRSGLPASSSKSPGPPGSASPFALSTSETAFASSLSRPTMGSLNLLRHLEKPSSTSSRTSTTAGTSSLTRRSIVPAAPSKPGDTFANFFEGLKKASTGVSNQSQRLRGINSVNRGGRIGLATEEDFVDLGPVDVPNSRASYPSVGGAAVNPTGDLAHRRTLALVRARGGLQAMKKAARIQSQKRISETIDRSATKRPRPSPLSQILDIPESSTTAPLDAVKENIPLDDKMDPAAGEEEGKKEMTRKRQENREELARLVQQGSSHVDLVNADENLAEKKLLSRLEAKDAIEERLVGQHEQECQIVCCSTCNYRSLRASMGCRKAGHHLEFSTGKRRFFACRSCKTRTTTLDRYPQFACSNCGESLFEKTGAIAERKGPKLAHEKLLVRGVEEKYLT